MVRVLAELLLNLRDDVPDGLAFQDVKKVDRVLVELSDTRLSVELNQSGQVKHKDKPQGLVQFNAKQDQVAVFGLDLGKGFELRKLGI